MLLVEPRQAADSAVIGHRGVAFGSSNPREQPRRVIAAKLGESVLIGVRRESNGALRSPWGRARPAWRPSRVGGGWLYAAISGQDDCCVGASKDSGPSWPGVIRSFSRTPFLQSSHAFTTIEIENIRPTAWVYGSLARRDSAEANFRRELCHPIAGLGDSRAQDGMHIRGRAPPRPRAQFRHPGFSGPHVAGTLAIDTRPGPPPVEARFASLPSASASWRAAFRHIQTRAR